MNTVVFNSKLELWKNLHRSVQILYIDISDVRRNKFYIFVTKYTFSN